MKVYNDLQEAFAINRKKQSDLISGTPPKSSTRKYSNEMEEMAQIEYGFKESFESLDSIDGERQPIPWMTYSAIFYLEQLDLSSHNVYEWGCGNSSLFFSSRAKKITSIESNPEWFDYINQRKSDNNQVFLQNSENYAKCIFDEPNPIDLIIIDGDIYRRFECAVYAIEKLAEGGIIVLDNSDWLEHTCSFLRDQGFTQIDFAGPGPINSYMWCTSIFFKNSIKFNSKSGKRPAFLESGMKNIRDFKVNQIQEKKSPSKKNEPAIISDLITKYCGLKRDVLPSDVDIYSSQEGEDILIKRLLKWHYNSVGFYIDVGAHHPVRFSNTFHYYLKGWSGINIEPCPSSLDLFNETRPRDVNLSVGISDQTGELEYFEFKETAFNSFDPNSVEYAKTRTELLKSTNIAVQTLESVLDEHLPDQQTISFLTVDVEGLELKALKSSNWSKYRPHIVCVEALTTSQLELIDQYMTSVAYTRVASTKNSYLYCEDEFWEQVK